MECCAGSCWETGPSSERKKTGEDRAAVYVSFEAALHRRPMHDPSWKLCGPWTHTCTHSSPSSYYISQFLHNWLEPHFYVHDLMSCLSSPALQWCRGGRGLQQTTINRAPELDSVFILLAVTCHNFCRGCLYWHSAHSALFINTQTQEVLFIRQPDRDQLEVRRTLAQRGNYVKPLEVWGFVLC